MELAEVQTSPLLFSQTLIAIQKRYQLYANIFSWLRNVRFENLASDEDRKMLIAKLDGNVADVVHSIYPICPTKLNKNELASILLNRLSEKRQLLIKLDVEVVKDDSGVFTEEEELMLVDECLTHCDSNSRDTLKRKEEELMSVDECVDYFDSKSLDTLSSQPSMATVLELFGFNDLRDQQKEIVDAVLKGRDCLAIMPTGGGKSTCYFLPGLMQQGVTIVISPLNALIDDQITQLVSLGVQATSFPLETLMIESFLNNSSSECAIKFLYLTPEKLCNALKDGNERNVLKNLMDKLYERKQLLRLIVDEAQCITTWGLDFRKDYGNLLLFRNFFPAVPVLALTGTANVQTRRDITDTLRLRNPFVSVRPCVRDNLKISFTHKKSNDHAFKLMKERLKDDFPNESGIIYCIKKAESVNLSSFLEKEGFSVTFYHSEVPKDEQKRRLANWMSGHVKIICATIAFGMGINKPDVRFVFHLSMPKSMESFYQECGRAGRDGQLAFCILFYKFSDYFEQQSLINYDPNGTKVRAIQSAELEILKKMAIFCENRTVCRNVGIASFFDETRRPCNVNSPAVCDVCETTDQYVEVDVIQLVRDIMDTIITNWSTRFTMSFLVSIFRAKEIDKKRISNTGDVKNFAMYGKGEDWKADNAFRLFQKMLLDNVLEESLVSLPPIPTYAVMRIGSNWPLEKYPVMMIQEEVTEQSNRPKKRFRAE